MDDPADTAAEYRKKAAVCLEVADRMPLEADRVMMLEMAQHWLEFGAASRSGAKLTLIERGQHPASRVPAK